MKLSILDQAPISSGQTAEVALQVSVKLAQLGESLGYERFWMAEHHDLFGLACPNPDVMLAHIGTQTKSIRIGAGAVLLPYYKPFRVAETYNLLATLFPGRIDLGLGRAPGGSAEVSLALVDNYLQAVGRYSQSIDELMDFIQGTVPEDSMFANIKPSPLADNPPDLWLLGTSERSALLAADKGMAYAFGHFMSDFPGQDIVQSYRERFTKKDGQKPTVIIAVHVICAPTTEEAYQLAKSTRAWSLLQAKQHEDLRIPSLEEVDAYAWTEEEERKLESQDRRLIIGNPEEVARELNELAMLYEADELMLVTITHDPEAKFTSYKLVAEAMAESK